MQNWDVPSMTAARTPCTADFEPLARRVLECCPKEDADKATTIRRRLKADLGRWQAEAVLSLFREAPLKHKGVCSRYFTDGAGKTIRLRM